MISVTDPNNGVRRYAYDVNNRLISVQDPNNDFMVQNTNDAQRTSKYLLALSWSNRSVMTFSIASLRNRTVGAGVSASPMMRAAT